MPGARKASFQKRAASAARMTGRTIAETNHAMAAVSVPKRKRRRR